MRLTFFPIILATILLLFSHVNSFNTKSCEFSEDCPELHLCGADRYCQHKPLFPMTMREMFGATILAIFVGFTNLGGSGGGLIMIPVVIAFFNYSLKDSYLTCEMLSLGGSCGNFFYFVNSRHQITHGPLVNYNLVLLTLPMLVIGEIFGFVLKNYLPQSVLLPTLVLVLMVSLKRCYRRLEKLKTNESDEIVALYHRGKEYLNDNPNDDVPLMISNIKETRDFVYEKRMYPLTKFTVIFFILALSFWMTSLRGSKKFQSPFHFTYCGLGYWETYSLVLIVNLIIAYKVSRHLIDLTERMRMFSERAISIDFTQHNTNDYLRNGFEAGFFGGMLGLGSGVILAPFWLQSGLLPQEATATSILCVIIASIISNSQVIYSFNIDYQLFGFFFAIAFCSSHIIARMAKRIIEKNNKQSFLAYILFGKIFLSICLLPILTIHRLIDEEESFFSFKSPC